MKDSSLLLKPIGQIWPERRNDNMKKSKGGMRGIVKKTLLSLAITATVLGGIFYASATLSPDPVSAQAAQINATANDPSAMQAEIEELRALIQLLLQNMNGNTNQNQQAAQAAVPQISSQSARDIAVELVGHGTARDVVLFTENGVLTFEVEVRHNNVRYMVYVNAANGGVIRMSRHEDGVQGITTLPEVINPPITPQTTAPPTQQTPSGNWSSPSPGNNWSSPSPGGRSSPSSS